MAHSRQQHVAAFLVITGISFFLAGCDQGRTMKPTINQWDVQVENGKVKKSVFKF